MGKLSVFSVPLKTMPEGTQEFAYHLDKQFFVNMESTDVHDADLDVKLDVVHKNDIYYLSFHITGTVTLICDRCLDDLILPIDTTYDIAVKYGDDYSETDDMLIIPGTDLTLNVSYMIHDTVSLAIPLKHVHPLGKCNRAMSALLRKHRAVKDGEDAELAESLIDEMETMDDNEPVASIPGDDAPVDPRWDGLKKLSDSMPDGDE